METIEQRWKGWLQLLFGLGLTVLFFYMMSPFVVALLLGAVTAILCYPLYETLRKKCPRALAGFLVTLCVTTGLLLPVVFVLYSGSVKLLGLFGRMKISTTSANLETWLHHPSVNRLFTTISRVTPVDREWIRAQSMELMQGIIERLSHMIAVFLSGMPGLLLAFFIVIISSYFFVVDGSKFLRFLSSISPLPPDRSRELYGAFEKSCRGVVLGLFASAALQGALMALFFAISGLPSVAFVFIITIIMGMVPVVGSAPIWIGATTYLFLTEAPFFGVMMLIGGIIISTSDNLVRAYLMKGHSEMHPLLALVSVFGAVNWMGPTGIFLGPIIAAVFVSFLRILAFEIRRENITALTEISGTKPVN